MGTQPDKVTPAELAALAEAAIADYGQCGHTAKLLDIATNVPRLCRDLADAREENARLRADCDRLRRELDDANGVIR